MSDVTLRSASAIVSDIKEARINGIKIDWPINEIVADMRVLSGEMIVDTQKYIDRGNKAAAKRVRDYTKCMETLGLAFRKKSV